MDGRDDEPTERPTERPTELPSERAVERSQPDRPPAERPAERPAEEESPPAAERSRAADRPVAADRPPAAERSRGPDRPLAADRPVAAASPAAAEIPAPTREPRDAREPPIRDPREREPPIRDPREREPPPRDPRDRDGDGIPDTLRQRLEALVPEIVKRTFTAGMGAVFSTEEGIRKLAKDNLPAAAGFVAATADGAKDKVLEVIARETREFLSNMNLTDEIAKILTTLSFEVKTEIRFIPNSERYGGVEPDVKARVRLKRQDRGDDDARPGLGSRIGRRLWRRGDGDPDPVDADEVDDPLDDE